MNNSKIYTSISIKREWMDIISLYSQQKHISKSHIICHVLRKHMHKLLQTPQYNLHPMKSQRKGDNYVSQHIAIKPELFEKLSDIKLMYRYTLSYLFGDAMSFFDKYMSDYAEPSKNTNDKKRLRPRYKYVLNATISQNLH
ncbi:MAG: hypothetical protein JXK07_06580 [Spirochaetes bacterium]|nr:hypothetical protein [Spirochaetota bacterium]MBN2771773.1 hypothetical protein [Spirochaetota bacterium]